MADWADTRDTLHLWTQIVGKVRMAHAPLVNHWWQATLYVSPRGLRTAAIPHRGGAFDCEGGAVLRRDDVRARRPGLPRAHPRPPE